MVDPSTRDANDVLHKITAIGSRNIESAQQFYNMLNSLPADDPASWGAKHGGLDGCHSYGSYEAVYAAQVCLYLSRYSDMADSAVGCRCYLHWNTAYVPSSEYQRGTSWGKARSLRKALHIGYGRA